MGALSPKLRKIEEGYVHYCPGCKQMHAIWVDEPHPNGGRWTFDGNIEAPTFSPSINIVGSCHYFIRSGNIEFCGDSRHALAGQTLPLPDVPLDLWPEDET